jgi:hypothetical protein
MKRRILSLALVLVVLAAATAVLAARHTDVPVVVDVRGNVTQPNAVALETALQNEMHTTRPMRMVVTISDRVVEPGKK